MQAPPTVAPAVASPVAPVRTPAAPSDRDVQYGPAAGWVLPPPTPTATPTPAGAPVRFDYFDQQIRLTPIGDDVYTAYRLRLLDSAALAAGAITVAWNPSSERLVVNAVRIVRDGKPTDVLEGTRFDVLQRENNLERSALDGELTATLQAPGLQVGDALEVAFTRVRSDRTFGARASDMVQLPTAGAAGVFRERITWPQGRDLRWRAFPDLPQLTPVDRDGRRELVYELRDPKSLPLPDGAPLRFRIGRVVQYSTFSSWAELSHLLWPMFDAAAQAEGAAVRAEAARIAAASPDPAGRAIAALRLVQERVRYVYVGLNGANYRPATAETTWERRFGDCKGKVVLLLALLRELHIEAEPVLVNAQGGDGADGFLPTPGVFDHVVLRARVDGRTYWLDGTRPGDHALSAVPPPAFRWGLPLRAGAVDLEAVPPTPPRAPLLVEVVEVDARAGFAAPAKVKMQHVLRDDGALASRAQLASVGPDDAIRAQKAYWRGQASWVEPTTVSWRFDDAQNALVLNMAGEGKPDWEGGDAAGRSLDVYGAGFRPPETRKRPAEEDQRAPWLVEFPRYRCFVTTLRLPPATRPMHWSYAAKPMNRRLEGAAYWRVASLEDDVMRTVMSTRGLTPEITADEARRTNEAIAGFDNNISRVFETDDVAVTARAPGAATPDVGAVDWTRPDAPCAAPEPPR